MQNSEHSFRVCIDGDDGMNEKPFGNAISRRTETTPPFVTSSEIDLGGILCGNNPPSTNGQLRPGHFGSQQMLGSHLLRRQQPPGSQRASTAVADPLKDQRMLRDNLVEHHRRPLIEPYVAKPRTALPNIRHASLANQPTP